MKEKKDRKNVLKKENSHNFKTKIKVMAMIKLENQDSKFRVVTKGFCTEWLEDTVKNREKVKEAFAGLKKYWGNFFRPEELNKVLGIKEEQTVTKKVVIKKAKRVVKKKAAKKGKKVAKKAEIKEESTIQEEEVIVESENNKFRVVGKNFRSKWMADTRYNRKIVPVMLRYIEDKKGQSLFSLQELAGICESEDINRMYYYITAFKNSGEDFYKYLHNKRKVDEEVVEEVRKILRREPLKIREQIAAEVNRQLKRKDVNAQNVDGALKEISCLDIRLGVKKQLAQGKAHYREEELIKNLFEIIEKQRSKTKVSVVREEIIKYPVEALASRNLKQERTVEKMESALKNTTVEQKSLYNFWQSQSGWKLMAFLLYFHGMSLSSIGKLLGTHKSTIGRWLADVAKWANFYIAQQKIAYSEKIGIDEKWIKIDDSWWYLFAAVDCVTKCPLLVSLYPSNNGNYCRLFLTELKNRGYSPKLIITDGFDGYIRAIAEVFPGTEHSLCHFHVIKSIYRRLSKNRIFDSEISIQVGRLFRTLYKRTFKRRIEKLKRTLKQEQINPVLSGLHDKLPQVIKAVGSTWRPSTANCVEQFFSRFERFYRLKGPFCHQDSAQKHIDLFLLGYLFCIQANGRACPLEKTGCDVAKMPFYHLFNRPNAIILKDRIAQQYKDIA